ncbi:hypothetical protein GWK47_006753 [Chionoecetes opilio]|uniref:Uncharacterized protein n=1 Tax=Chionoecetes opilio TaxID=41210 RepID=A0A8J4YFM4_CHIOP|nr:hypothetical protein GWK47_006753 [Chionoecetes opilio]
MAVAYMCAMTSLALVPTALNLPNFLPSGFDFNVTLLLNLSVLYISHLTHLTMFTEAIASKGEVQALQGKLLHMPNNNVRVDTVFMETEKHIKELFEAINGDFNIALDQIVKAVEKVAKVKQLVAGIENMIQGSIQSTSIFNRTPGSRTPLKGSGSTSSPRQRAVPPMVAGHVLQPAMVPLPKLKVDWSDKRNNHLLTQDNGLNMTTIGEQSTPDTSEVSGEQHSPEPEETQSGTDDVATPDDSVAESQSQNELDTAVTPTRSGENTSRRYSMRCKAEASSEPSQSTENISLSTKGFGLMLPQEMWWCHVDAYVTPRARCGNVRVSCRVPPRKSTARGSGRRKSSGARASKASPAKASAEEQEVHTSTRDEDPLEGPSWLLDVGKKSWNSSTRYHRQRVKALKQKCAYDSSDEDDDGTKNIKTKPKARQRRFPKSRFTKKVYSPVTTPKASPLQSADQTYVDSPTSMLARIEALEAIGGRKSKRFLKSRKRNVIMDSLEGEDGEAPVSVEQDKKPDGGTTQGTQEVDAGAASLTVNNKEVPCNISLSISDSPEDFRGYNDVTCKIVANMDMTLPVSNPIIHENPATSQEKCTNNLQDDSKCTHFRKKFFKSKETELLEDVQEKQERTPFDKSMINESVVKMPPFSSTRTTEKENLPPPLAENSNGSMNLCEVSVVLEDVMKQPGHSQTPKRVHKVTQKGESQSDKCMSTRAPRKMSRVTRKTLQYTVNCNDEEESSKPKRVRKTKKQSKKEQTHNAADCIVDSTPNAAANPPDNELSIVEPVESGDKKAGNLLSDKTAKEADLSECFVVVHRKSIVESRVSVNNSGRTPKNAQECSNVLSDLQQQQQSPLKNRTNSQAQGEVEAAQDPPGHRGARLSRDTQRNSNHVDTKGECEENVLTGVESNEPETECVLQDAANPCDERILQGEESDVEVISAFKGFEGSEKVKKSRKTRGVVPDTECVGAAANSGTEKATKARSNRKEGSVEHSNEVQKATQGIGSAEDYPSEDGRRKRRAVSRVTSFKELGLKGKMRREETDTVLISRSAVKQRGRPRGKRGRGRGQAVVKCSSGGWGGTRHLQQQVQIFLKLPYEGGRAFRADALSEPLCSGAGKQVVDQGMGGHMRTVLTRPLLKPVPQLLQGYVAKRRQTVMADQPVNRPLIPTPTQGFHTNKNSGILNSHPARVLRMCRPFLISPVTQEGSCAPQVFPPLINT